VGKVVRAIDDLGLGGKTVILFTSDNGTDGYGKGKLGQEKGVRVPMILRCVNLIESGSVSDELVELGDVFPTLIDLAGKKSMLTDYPVDGQSFAAILQDKHGPRRKWIFSYMGKAQFLRDKRWLRDGNGNFWDCGNKRDEEGYIDVTNSSNREVLDAKVRFEQILRRLPNSGIIKQAAPPPCTKG
jgi:arylsulfatase A-like enzyme